jgi:hypothetical protein
LIVIFRSILIVDESSTTNIFLPLCSVIRENYLLCVR